MDFFKTPRSRKTPRTYANKYSNYGYYSHSEDTDSNSEETYSNYSTADESQEVEIMADLTDVKLNSAWDFYYTRNDVENYEERLVYVATFKSVKEFWALYQHVKLPAYLPQGNLKKMLL